MQPDFNHRYVTYLNITKSTTLDQINFTGEISASQGAIVRGSTAPDAGLYKHLTYSSGTPTIANIALQSLDGSAGPAGNSPVDTGSASTLLVVPIVSNYSPLTGSTAGRTEVIFNGSNLTVATITFGGAAASFVSGGGGSITVTTPAHAAGAVNIQIVTPCNSLAITNGFIHVANGATLNSVNAYGIRAPSTTPPPVTARCRSPTSPRPVASTHSHALCLSSSHSATLCMWMMVHSP